MIDATRWARRAFVVGALSGSVLNVCGQIAGCNLLNIYDPDALSKGRKIGLAVFEVGGGGVAANAGPLEKPREILLERFQRDLKKSKLFSDVSVVAPDAESDSDYILEGNLIGINGGSRGGRSFNTGIGAAAQMRVSGRILGAGRGDSRPVVSDWECNVFQSGLDLGYSLGPAGILAGVIRRSTQTNEKLTKKNADFVADALTLQLRRLLRGKEGKTELDKRVANDEKEGARSPITGKSEAKNRSWREKAEWQEKDYLNEIDSFIVRSRETKSRGVDALWLTSASYNAHAKLLGSMKQTAILQGHDLKRGMLTDIDPVKPFLDQDVVVLVATFDVHATAAPFLWDSNRIKASTYLTRGDGTGDKLAPAQFLDGKIASYMVLEKKNQFRAFHPVILAFPTRRVDGTPFFQTIDDVAELHTEVDGRQVQITFNLTHFDLKSVDDLKMSGPSPKGN